MLQPHFVTQGSRTCTKTSYFAWCGIRYFLISQIAKRPSESHEATHHHARESKAATHPSCAQRPATLTLRGTAFYHQARTRRMHRDTHTQTHQRKKQTKQTNKKRTQEKGALNKPR